MSDTQKLRVWWIPQNGVGLCEFHYEVPDVPTGGLVLNAIAQYDLFQFENHIKPDFSNAGGLEFLTDRIGDDGQPEWEEWESEDGEVIDEYMERLQVLKDAA